MRTEADRHLTYLERQFRRAARLSVAKIGGPCPLPDVTRETAIHPVLPQHIRVLRQPPGFNYDAAVRAEEAERFRATIASFLATHPDRAFWTRILQKLEEI